jgi:transcriptional regulator with AAA-type ATPase domain
MTFADQPLEERTLREHRALNSTSEMSAPSLGCFAVYATRSFKPRGYHHREQTLRRYFRRTPRFSAFGSGCSLGRTQDNDIVLPGDLSSRQHARVRRDSGVFEVEDLGSKNGTHVNGGRITRASLVPQDILRVGDWLGVVVALPAAGPPPPIVRELAPGWFVGASSQFDLAGVQSIARGTLSVVLCGETGTGKEVSARGLHVLSGRAGKFVALNCAAIAETVAEAQLFGHRRGAFTGAHADNKGLIEAANGGTLFLDEVADLSLPMQAKLLRALEERAITPVGTTSTIPVDFRVICATQEPLETLVERGQFRGDLMARLSGIQLDIPPLRERREEIFPLFLRYLSESGGTHRSPTARFVERMLCHNYPYNVRELVQLTRVLAIKTDPSIAAEEFPERKSMSRTPPEEVADGERAEKLRGLLVSESSRREIWLLRNATDFTKLKEVLATNGGNVSEAARSLGIPRYRAVRLIAAAKELSQRDGLRLP